MNFIKKILSPFHKIKDNIKSNEIDILSNEQIKDFFAKYEVYYHIEEDGFLPEIKKELSQIIKDCENQESFYNSVIEENKTLVEKRRTHLLEASVCQIKYRAIKILHFQLGLNNHIKYFKEDARKVNSVEGKDFVTIQSYDDFTRKFYFNITPKANHIDYKEAYNLRKKWSGILELTFHYTSNKSYLAEYNYENVMWHTKSDFNYFKKEILNIPSFPNNYFKMLDLKPFKVN